MDLVFLDANVLFSAAYREDAGVARLWKRDDIELISSEYALEETRRNLREAEQLERLERLIARLRLITALAALELPAGVELPDKDRPILAAAIHAGATHLLTGDVAHFGALFGSVVGGVRILPPARHLLERP